MRQSERNIYVKNHYISEILKHFPTVRFNRWQHYS